MQLAAPQFYKFNLLTIPKINSSNVFAKDCEDTERPDGVDTLPILPDFSVIWLISDKRANASKNSG